MVADGNYGTMRIKPASGDAPSATTERKTEGVLPAYCNPPNPCPLGYTCKSENIHLYSQLSCYSIYYAYDIDHIFYTFSLRAREAVIYIYIYIILRIA